MLKQESAVTRSQEPNRINPDEPKLGPPQYRESRARHVCSKLATSRIAVQQIDEGTPRDLVDHARCWEGSFSRGYFWEHKLSTLAIKVSDGERHPHRRQLRNSVVDLPAFI